MKIATAQRNADVMAVRIQTLEQTIAPQHADEVESARKALAAALSRMILNGEVSEQKALQFAHAYLHDNAARIYPTPLQ